MSDEQDRPETLTGRFVMCGALDAVEYVDQPVPRYSVLMEQGQVSLPEQWIDVFKHLPRGAHVDISIDPGLDEAHEVRPGG
jgi:hypothetical protein